ncbi:MAG: DUF2993 domain-containing protein [Firmicutes bacterium]|nr:DUF2993 domain-containing protein [Bacillota bacterium]
MKCNLIIAVIIPLIIVSGVIVSIVMPAIANNVIQVAVVDTLGQRYGLGDHPYVRVDSDDFSFLTGKFKQVYIESPERDFNGIKAQSLVVCARDVDLDFKTFILSRRVKVRRIGKVSSRMIFGEDELNRYVSSRYPDSSLRMDLCANKITGKAGVEMIGDMEVLFKPRLRGDHMVLEPVDAKFSCAKMMNLDNARNWVKEISLDLPVSNLPFGLRIAKISVMNNELMVVAEN